MTTLRSRLLGLVATLGIAAFVIGVPALLVVIGAVPSMDAFSWDVLSARDDGTLAMAVIGVVAWVAWLVMAMSLAVETLAHVRGIRAPRIPGLGMPQLTAGRLVAAASLLFIALPIGVQAAPEPAVAVAAAPPVPVSAPAMAEAHPAPVAERPVEAPAGSQTVPYVTKRGDSLWRIAAERLGDGRRYVEIVALNEAALHGGADFIDPGLALRLPSDAAPANPIQADASDPESYVVEPGDTLWDIAEDELGEGARYLEIFEATDGTVQPDGQHLSDPDLIRPGWTLTIPGAVTDPPAEDDQSKIVDDPPEDAQHEGSSDLPRPSKSASPTEAPQVSAEETHAVDGDEDSPISWAMPGLMGAGALLAGAVLVTVRAHRRTQQRHRRPGFAIAPPPPELRAIEKTAIVSGGPTADVIEQLDRMLRHLAAQVTPLPLLDSVEIDKQSVTLHLAEPADLPDPWSGSDTAWTTPIDATVGDEDQLPPYPLLASVGQGDDGHLWLLDMERLGAVALTGDGERAEALARHLAAELALSPWAVLTEIDTVAVASELAPLVPGRLTHHTADDIDFLTGLRASLGQAQLAGHGDPEPYRALLVAGSASGDDVRSLVDLVLQETSRLGYAVVRIGAAEAGERVVELTSDGRLRVPHLGLDLTSAGLSSEEARATAAIVDLTRDASVVPIAHNESETGWRAIADQAGALREELTEHRPSGEAGPGSLLPEATQRYEAVSATMAVDVHTLAPVVPEQVRRTIAAADAQLDADLDEWRDPESCQPKLTLLGPVNLAAPAGVLVGEVVERKAYFTEMVAYLALHPKGVSSRQVCDAFGIKASRARTDLGCIRKWFGTSPRTGLQHLPPANSSPAHRERGTHGYQLQDVLVDFDLFRRLRIRAAGRGAEGIPDLVAALELVTGEPFSALRDSGWSWLLDDERIYETATLAVVDVAHVVAADALSLGDLAKASFAAETGCRAAPYDEVCRLDLAKVAEAQGHTALAEQILDEEVFNRSDDHQPPIDLPGRTAAVVENHDWSHRKRPAAG